MGKASDQAERLSTKPSCSLTNDGDVVAKQVEQTLLRVAEVLVADSSSSRDNC